MPTAQPDSPGIRHVLLIVNEEAHIRELSRLAHVLLQTEDLRPIVFMEDRLKQAEARKVFAGCGIEVWDSDSVVADKPPMLPSARRMSIRRMVASLVASPALARRMPGRFRYRFGFLGVQDVEMVDILRNAMLRRAAVADAVLAQRSWAAIVLCEDNPELDTGIWIEVARQRGVRSVIVPYTISNTAEFAESYVGFAPYQLQATPQNRLVGRLFPDWVLNHKDRTFLRSNCTKIIAVEQLGLTPPNPWLLNSGYADAIAVESDAMYDYYRAAGIPAQQLVKTGSLADDVMVAARDDIPLQRQRVLSQFGWRDDRPLLLCALPPDQNTFDRPGCEFENFDELIEMWGDCLAGLTGWNVVVRPHPKTPAGRVDALRGKGLAVSYDDTATLVPICDLYVASVTATIRWAVACGKPVINYDVYQYGYEDYRDLGGVVLVNSRDEFSSALLEMTGDDDKRAAIAEIQRGDATRWARLDGASGRRLVELLRSPPGRPAINYGRVLNTRKAR